MNIKSTARVYRFHQYGDPAILKLEDLPVLDPGPGQVLVRVQALSLNRADLLWLANTYVEVPSLPARIGYEIAGAIEAIGPDVSGFQTGDRVSSIPAFSINEEAFNRGRRFLSTGLNDGSLPTVPIDREFRGLESLPDALRYMATSQAAGKIVVTL